MKLLYENVCFTSNFFIQHQLKQQPQVVLRNLGCRAVLLNWRAARQAPPPPKKKKKCWLLSYLAAICGKNLCRKAHSICFNICESPSASGGAAPGPLQRRQNCKALPLDAVMQGH